jgi:hypothetical protein
MGDLDKGRHKASFAFRCILQICPIIYSVYVESVLVFHHCDKIPQKSNLTDGKIYFGS